MPPFWPDLARVTRRALPLLLAIAALHTLGHHALAREDRAWVIFALFPPATYLLYRIALFDLRAPCLAPFVRRQMPDLPREAFLRFVLVLVLPFLIACAALFLLARVVQPDSREATTLVLFTVAGLFWLLLARLGTLLPAAAAGQPFSPRAALMAGRHTWTGVALQLYLIAGLGGLALFIAVAQAYHWLDRLQAAPPLHHTLDILITALGWANLIPTTVILTRAYTQAWPRPSGA